MELTGSGCLRAGMRLGKGWRSEIQLREAACSRHSAGAAPGSSLLSLYLGYKISVREDWECRMRPGGKAEHSGNLLSNGIWSQAPGRDKTDVGKPGNDQA